MTPLDLKPGSIDHGPMRLLFAVVLSALLIGQASCMRRGGENAGYRRLTGTCEGACDHYRSCKASRQEPVSDPGYGACVVECSEVFSSAESLRAFESLSCDDAVAFVEGSSGRGPGVLISDSPSDSLSGSP